MALFPFLYTYTEIKPHSCSSHMRFAAIYVRVDANRTAKYPYSHKCSRKPILCFAICVNTKWMCANHTAKNHILAHYEKLAFLELSPPVLPQCQPWDGWPLPTWSFFWVRALGLHEWLGARWRHSHVCAQKPPFPARALKVRHCKLDFQSACGDDLIGCMHSEYIFKWCKIRR